MMRTRAVVVASLLLHVLAAVVLAAIHVPSMTEPSPIATLTGSQVAIPASPPGRPACMLNFHDGDTIPNPLAQLRVLVALATGATSFHAVAALQYYQDRGASVDVWCHASPPLVLLEVYYPTTYLSANQAEWCASTAVNGTDYDVLVVPGGYAHVLALRVDPAFQRLLRDFVAASSQPRALVVLDEGAEVMIDVEGLLPSLSGPVFPGNTTPAVVAAARAAQCNVTFAANTSTVLVTSVIRPSLRVAWTTTASSGDGLLRSLRTVSSSVFSFDGDATLPSSSTSTASLNCSDPASAVALTIPAGLSPVSGDDFLAGPQWWGPSLNTGLYEQLPPSLLPTSNNGTLALGLLDACTNPQGENTCEGQVIALVVAHGSHDAQLVALWDAIVRVGATPRTYCPDTDEQNGFIYAMPVPSVVPTYVVPCSTYYNETFLSLEDYIFIVGGAIATHRRLRQDANLLAVLSSEGPSVALYGTAMSLLASVALYSTPAATAGESVVDSVEAPYCIFTAADLRNAGVPSKNASGGVSVSYNVTRGDGVTFFEASATRKHQRTLGGYLNTSFLLSSFPLFCQTAVKGRAWSASSTAPVDRVVGAIFISLAVFAVVAVVGFKLVQRRLKASRSAAYVSLKRAEEECEIH